MVTHIIAYSGGLGSFETAYQTIKNYGSENVRCVFTDTLTEDFDLYRFLNDTINYLRCDFVPLVDGRNIWGVFNDERFMGNSRIDPCSKLLKREIFKKWISSNYPNSDDIIIYYGIQSHESHRIKAIKERYSPYKISAPLIELGITKEDILFHLDSIGINPPRLYDLGFDHNNCGGFCVKAGQRQFLHLLKTLPDVYNYHETEQEKLFSIIGKHGFIKKTSNGITQYLSLKDFRESVIAGKPIQMYQDGACACFA